MKALKVFIISIVASLLFGVTVNSGVAFAASESLVVENREILRNNQSSFEYNPHTDEIEFSSNKAVANGLDKSRADEAASYFNSLTESDKREVLRSFNQKSPFRVAPIIVWAANVIGGWLAEKLLDYGAAKFCKHYRNYNGATKKVCRVIA